MIKLKIIKNKITDHEKKEDIMFRNIMLNKRNGNKTKQKDYM